MSFVPSPYSAPDFSREPFLSAPDCALAPAPKDAVAPENYHAMSIYPEYFKIGGRWLLAEDSRMDCVAVYESGKIFVREFRLLKQGDLVVLGRREDAGEGVYLYPDGFHSAARSQEAFAFRQSRSRETAFSRDYDQLYEILQYECSSKDALPRIKRHFH